MKIEKLGYAQQCRRALNEKFGLSYDNSELVHLFTLYYTMRT